MSTYITAQGDTIDYICWSHYGQQSGAVEAVLEANRSISLADAGPVLPAGLVIELPPLPTPVAEVQPLRLWG